MHITEQAAARFWWNVRKSGPDECWEWIGTRNYAGYGFLGLGGKTRQASHVALELSGRARPEGLFALHSCDNRACVNPRHLRWGTHWENMEDAFARKRLPRAVTDEQAEAIRADERTLAEIAAEYGCSSTAIWRVKHGRSYKQKVSC